MPPKLIIFDKDGTLIDNHVIFSPVIKKMIKKLSCYTDGEQKLAKFIGYDLKNDKFVPEGFVLHSLDLSLYLK